MCWNLLDNGFTPRAVRRAGRVAAGVLRPRSAAFVLTPNDAAQYDVAIVLSSSRLDPAKSVSQDATGRKGRWRVRWPAARADAPKLPPSRWLSHGGQIRAASSTNGMPMCERRL